LNRLSNKKVMVVEKGKLNELPFSFHPAKWSMLAFAG